MSNQNGANRCPKCGATDISLEPKSGKLKCNFCRTVFENESANARGGVESLEGDVISEGAEKIVDEKIVLTLKCPACGAEVVINTEEVTHAKCHWCRHVLSINEKLPNGAVPDLVLPFQQDKSVAIKNIREFVEKRKFFAHPKFKAEFSPETVNGVYLPYMIVDANTHMYLSGEGERTLRTYTVGSGDSKETRYDAEVSDVSRTFDLLVDDLTIEASSDKLNQNTLVNTNNVINAIMPFDTENAVAWNAGFLRGFTSEKRDTDVEVLKPLVDSQLRDVGRFAIKDSISKYDRGINWNTEQLTIKGTKWKAAYLPIWLYSYLEVKGNNRTLHYVAVNARNGKTMGSVPINMLRLMVISAIIEFIGIYFGINIMTRMDGDDIGGFALLFFTPGFIFYWYQKIRYRNLDKRYHHEAQVVSEVKNLESTDNVRTTRKGLRHRFIAGRNDNVVRGAVMKNKAVVSSIVAKMIDDASSKKK